MKKLAFIQINIICFEILISPLIMNATNWFIYKRGIHYPKFIVPLIIFIQIAVIISLLYLDNKKQKLNWWLYSQNFIRVNAHSIVYLNGFSLDKGIESSSMFFLYILTFFNFKPSIFEYLVWIVIIGRDFYNSFTESGFSNNQSNKDIYDIALFRKYGK